MFLIGVVICLQGQAGSPAKRTGVKFGLFRSCTKYKVYLSFYENWFYQLLPKWCISPGSRSVDDLNNQASAVIVLRTRLLLLNFSYYTTSIDVNLTTKC